MKEHTFTVGQQVIATCSYAWFLVEGKTYTVLDYQPSVRDEYVAFTWPAYVTVEDASGNKIECHARRFRPCEPGPGNLAQHSPMAEASASPLKAPPATSNRETLTTPT